MSSTHPYNVGKTPGLQQGSPVVDDRWLQIKQASHRSASLIALHSLQLSQSSSFFDGGCMHGLFVTTELLKQAKLMTVRVALAYLVARITW